MANIPFIGTFTEARELRVNAQKLVNLFPVPEGDAAKSRVALYSTPGLKPYKSAGLGPCRSNGVIFQNKTYFVSGNKLVSFDTAGTVTEVGTLVTNSGRVVMDVAAMMEYLLDNKGKAYDYAQIGKIWAHELFPRIKGSESGDKFICSEYVSGALEAGGVDPCLYKVGSYTTPADLSRSPVLTHVLDFMI